MGGYFRDVGGGVTAVWVVDVPCWLILAWVGEPGQLPALAATQSAKAAGLVQTGLLSLGAVEPAIPELAQYPRALHLGLEPLK